MSSGAPSSATTSNNVVFPARMKVTSSGLIVSLIAILCHWRGQPESTRVRAINPTTRRAHSIGARAGWRSVTEGPELEFEPIGPLAEHHLIDHALLVEHDVEIVAHDVRPREKQYHTGLDVRSEEHSSELQSHS